MRTLIIYGTTEGHTRKIASFASEELQKLGHTVVVHDATQQPPSPEGFDAVIIASSIHMGAYQTAVKDYVHHHATALSAKRSAFLSVCLAVASGTEEAQEEADAILHTFLQNTGWAPTDTMEVAGALKYTQYDFFKRLALQMIAKRSGGSTDTSCDHEYTDWTALARFLSDFAA
jgi:menaquinone-dependent protoporphyrinogen oxidase